MAKPRLLEQAGHYTAQALADLTGPAGGISPDDLQNSGLLDHVTEALLCAERGMDYRAQLAKDPGLNDQSRKDWLKASRHAHLALAADLIWAAEQRAFKENPDWARQPTVYHRQIRARVLQLLNLTIEKTALKPGQEPTPEHTRAFRAQFSEFLNVPSPFNLGRPEDAAWVFRLMGVAADPGQQAVLDCVNQTYVIASRILTDFLSKAKDCLEASEKLEAANALDAGVVDRDAQIAEAQGLRNAARLEIIEASDGLRRAIQDLRAFPVDITRSVTHQFLTRATAECYDLCKDFNTLGVDEAKAALAEASNAAATLQADLQLRSQEEIERLEREADRAYRREVAQVMEELFTAYSPITQNQALMTAVMDVHDAGHVSVGDVRQEVCAKLDKRCEYRHYFTYHFPAEIGPDRQAQQTQLFLRQAFRRAFDRLSPEAQAKLGDNGRDLWNDFDDMAAWNRAPRASRLALLREMFTEQGVIRQNDRDEYVRSENYMGLRYSELPADKAAQIDVIASHVLSGLEVANTPAAVQAALQFDCNLKLRVADLLPADRLIANGPQAAMHAMQEHIDAHQQGIRDKNVDYTHPGQVMETCAVVYGAWAVTEDPENVPAGDPSKESQYQHLFKVMWQTLHDHHADLQGPANRLALHRQTLLELAKIRRLPGCEQYVSDDIAIQQEALLRHSFNPENSLSLISVKDQTDFLARCFPKPEEKLEDEVGPDGKKHKILAVHPRQGLSPEEIEKEFIALLKKRFIEIGIEGDQAKEFLNEYYTALSHAERAALKTAANPLHATVVSNMVADLGSLALDLDLAAVEAYRGVLKAEAQRLKDLKTKDGLDLERPLMKTRGRMPQDQGPGGLGASLFYTDDNDQRTSKEFYEELTGVRGTGLSYIPAGYTSFRAQTEPPVLPDYVWFPPDGYAADLRGHFFQFGLKDSQTGETVKLHLRLEPQQEPGGAAASVLISGSAHKKYTVTHAQVKAAVAMCLYNMAPGHHAVEFVGPAAEKEELFKAFAREVLLQGGQDIQVVCAGVKREKNGAMTEIVSAAEQEKWLAEVRTQLEQERRDLSLTDEHRAALAGHRAVHQRPAEVLDTEDSDLFHLPDPVDPPERDDDVSVDSEEDADAAADEGLPPPPPPPSPPVSARSSPASPLPPPPLPLGSARLSVVSAAGELDPANLGGAAPAEPLPPEPPRLSSSPAAGRLRLSSSEFGDVEPASRASLPRPLARPVARGLVLENTEPMSRLKPGLTLNPDATFTLGSPLTSVHTSTVGSAMPRRGASVVASPPLLVPFGGSAAAAAAAPPAAARLATPDPTKVSRRDADSNEPPLMQETSF